MSTRKIKIPVVKATARDRAFFAALDREEAEGREVAEALKPFGFVFHHTGGGCTAWSTEDAREIGADPKAPKAVIEVSITDGDSKAPLHLSDPCLVSVTHGGYCEESLMMEFRTVRAFLKVAVCIAGKFRPEGTK